MRRVDSLEKTLMLGKFEGRRRRGWQRMRWLDGITDSLPRHDEDLREPLVRRQGSQVSMRVARGSASWLSSHGRVWASALLPLPRASAVEVRTSHA